MSYAVIRTGGKQYRVSQGDTLEVERLEADPGQELELKDIVLVNRGDKVLTDAKDLKNLAVKVKVLAHGRGRKILVFKFKRRKGFERRKGHRQGFTRIQVSAIP